MTEPSPCVRGAVGCTPWVAKPHLNQTAKVRVKAKYHDDVEQWLKVLAGPEYPRLLQWISLVTDLNVTCAALYLHGPCRSGKSLFESGLARIWTEDRPHVHHGVGYLRYNQDILTCPLILDTASTLVLHSDSVKKEVTARRQIIRQKHEKGRTLDGCIRLILSSQSLYEADPEYVLSIQVANNEQYFRSLSPDVLESLVQGDRIAEHAMWIVENYATVLKS